MAPADPLDSPNAGLADSHGKPDTAEAPPSTGRTTPVTNSASADARNTTALATSSGRPGRVRSRRLSLSSFFASIPARPSRSSTTCTKATCTALHRTPYSAYSTAIDRVSDSSAPFTAVYPSIPGTPDTAAREEMLMMAPCPAAAIRRKSARVIRTVPVRLTLRMNSQFSSSISLSARSTPLRTRSLLAALFTRIVGTPRLSAASNTRSPTDGSVRSAATNVPLPPTSSKRCRTSSPARASRPVTTTDAPSLANRSAVARPIPWVEPVMIATSPASRSLTRGYFGSDELVVGVAAGKHDGLDLQELLVALAAAFGAETGLLAAAERAAATGSGRVVDLACSRVYLQGDGDSMGGVRREHRSTEAVRRVVGDRDGVGLVTVANHRDDRPEDLFLRHLHRVVDIDEDGGLDIPTVIEPGRTNAAERDMSTCGLSSIDEPFHLLALPLRHDRSEIGLRLVR